MSAPRKMALNVISGMVVDAGTNGTNGFLSMNAPEGGVKDARILAARAKDCQTSVADLVRIGPPR